jgi:hypothetical protein
MSSPVRAAAAIAEREAPAWMSPGESRTQGCALVVARAERRLRCMHDVACMHDVKCSPDARIPPGAWERSNVGDVFLKGGVINAEMQG